MYLRNNKGFTLLEVIVAMAILLVSIAIIFNLMFTAIKARNVSRERLQAIETASSVIDEIKSSRSSWIDREGLKTWLVNEGFLAGASGVDFSKVVTDSNSVSYSVYVGISSKAGIAGLFELFVTVQPPNAKQIGVETRLRGV